jgi:hypothetical protein
LTKNLECELVLSRNLDKNVFIAKKPSIKQGLPVEKKTLLTAVSISALLLSAGAQFVSLSRANALLELGFVPPDAFTKPPKITLSSPANGSVYTTNAILLSIHVDLPESSTASNTIIYYIRYQADWQQDEVSLYTNTGYSNSIESQIPLPEHHYFQGSQNLTGIPDGNHSIVVTVVAGGFYRKAGELGFYRFGINGSSSVTFTIDTAPIVSFLSFENRTFETSEVPLNFTVNQSVSKITYCLDGQENVTISGNTTITGLPNGYHNVTVYATDQYGNAGASETIYFNVDAPEPFPTMLVIASVITAVVVGIGLLVYLKKRKHQAEMVGSK